MNRLTEKNDNKIYTLKEMEWNPPLLVRSGCTIFDVLYRAIQKLGAYEDTGLMPDEIGKLNAETQEEARKMLEKVAKLSEKIEKAQERTRWIPVTERLPESGSMVLVSLEGISIPDIAECGGTSQEGIKFRPVDNDFAYAKGIVAWMPLPEPYREKEE
jgi:hypothetical protein